MVQCGVVWCGAVLWDVEWSVVLCCVVVCEVMWCGMVRFDAVWCGVVFSVM